MADSDDPGVHEAHQVVSVVLWVLTNHEDPSSARTSERQGPKTGLSFDAATDSRDEKAVVQHSAATTSPPEREFSRRNFQDLLELRVSIVPERVELWRTVERILFALSGPPGQPPRLPLTVTHISAGVISNRVTLADRFLSMDLSYFAGCLERCKAQHVRLITS